MPVPFSAFHWQPVSSTNKIAFIASRSGARGLWHLVVGGELIVELKSVEHIVHLAQVISYSRAFDRPLGLLIAFNVKLLRSGVRRVVLTRR